MFTELHCIVFRFATVFNSSVSTKGFQYFLNEKIQKELMEASFLDYSLHALITRCRILYFCVINEIITKNNFSWKLTACKYWYNKCDIYNIYLYQCCKTLKVYCKCKKIKSHGYLSVPNSQTSSSQVSGHYKCNYKSISGSKSVC